MFFFVNFKVNQYELCLNDYETPSNYIRIPFDVVSIFFCFPLFTADNRSLYMVIQNIVHMQLKANRLTYFIWIWWGINLTNLFSTTNLRGWKMSF